MISYNQKAMAAVVGCLLAAGLATAVEPTRYAVLSFEGMDGITAIQAADMTERCAGQLGRMAAFTVVDSRQAGLVLLRTGFRMSDHPSSEAAARAAGQILSVDYVVSGNVSRQGEKLILLTTLVEIRSGEVVRRVRTTFEGKYDKFLELAPPDNLKKLLQESVAVAGAPAPWGPVGDSGKPWFDMNIDWRDVGDTTMGILGGRVEAGTRMTYYSLINTHASDRFVGHIDELGAEQNYSLREEYFWAPANWFVSYKVTREWGVDMAWNKLRNEARNDLGDEPDGCFVLEGPIISGFRRYLNSSSWTPYAGLGIAWYRGDFDHEGWWRNGYQSKADYEALGPYPRKGKTRHMSLDDCWGYAVYVGTDVQLWKSLYADLLMRYVQVEGDVSYSSAQGTTKLYEKGPYNVPFSHIAWGLGLKWEF